MIWMENASTLGGSTLGAAVAFLHSRLHSRMCLCSRLLDGKVCLHRRHRIDFAGFGTMKCASTVSCV